MAVEGWAQPKYGYVEIDDFISNLRSFVGSVTARLNHQTDKGLGPELRLSIELGKIFDSQIDLDVVQIGANDGIQSDPLRQFFQSPLNYSAKLVEPIPHYCEKLLGLYGGRGDIEILNVSVGSQTGTLELFHISPPIAHEMNGEGPANNWALGQGSSSRATVVYWIYKNAWRGDAYTKQIPDYIAAIERISVPMVPTRELINFPKKTLLVVDVQGMDSEIIMGLDKNALPRWIVLEEDLGKEMATTILTDLGYSATRIGTDVLFELKIA
jgi:FkbM family methyltransferase